MPRQRAVKVAMTVLLLLGSITIGDIQGFARTRNETIDATAMGTGTQMGGNFGVTVLIYQYSTPADRQVLVDAFMKGQNQGLSSVSLVNCRMTLRTALAGRSTIGCPTQRGPVGPEGWGIRSASSSSA